MTSHRCCCQASLLAFLCFRQHRLADRLLNRVTPQAYSTEPRLGGGDSRGRVKQVERRTHDCTRTAGRPCSPPSTSPPARSSFTVYLTVTAMGAVGITSGGYKRACTLGPKGWIESTYSPGMRISCSGSAVPSDNRDPQLGDCRFEPEGIALDAPEQIRR